VEIIIGIIIFAVVLKIIVSVVGPLLIYASGIALGIGALVGVLAAFVSYIRAVARNRHPYARYTDKSANPQPARRSYFFGPGMNQLINIITDAWKGMWAWLSKVLTVAGVMLLFSDSWIIRIIMFLPAAALTVAAFVSVGLLGGIITATLSLIHASIIFAWMAVIYVLFSITWVIDRIYLKSRSIRTSCAYCQERYVIPEFECPNCGEIHTKLVPGPYGIWHRRCKCGHVLPTTFMNGRSELASSCPMCHNGLAASDASQVSISVVGGSSSGKTVLMSAFYHELFESIRRNGSRLSVEIPDASKYMFEDLERWYEGATCDPTAETDTSIMYSVLFNASVFDARKQFSVYDIAGEAFRDPEISAMIPQKQFKFSDGIVIVIDPLAAELMRSEAEANGDDITNYSESEASTVITNFVSYLKTNLSSKGVTRTIQKPVSVVITKADLPSVKRRISYTHIRHEVKQKHYADFDTARDELCKNFLADIGMTNAISAIDANFSNVHYYPVSAIGHEPDGEAYEPEHIMEPFERIITEADSALAELMGLQKTA